MSAYNFGYCYKSRGYRRSWSSSWPGKAQEIDYNEVVVYHNMTVLAGKELEPVSNAYLAVKDGLILDMGTDSAPPGVDLDEAVVIPAFINAHTHIADSGFKDATIGLPTEQAVSPPHGLKYRYLSALSSSDLKKILSDALQELCRNGITAFSDFREGGVEGTLVLREVLDQFPLRGVILAEPTQPPGESGFLQEIDEIAKHADGVGIGDIARFTDVELQAIRTTLGGRKLGAHVAETEAAQRECKRRWGKSEVERILECSPDLLVHLTNPVAGDLNLLAEAQIPVVCCARTNCILGDGIPPLSDLIKHDVPLALGTDNVMLTSPNMFREMDWFSRLVRGQTRCANAVSARQVLSIATFGGAKALGLDNELGTLEPGKVASFVVLDVGSINLRRTRDLYAAIVHRAGPADIRLVVSCGKEVYIRGEP